MSLEGSLDSLAARLCVLAEAISRLRLTAVEDRPAGAEQLILDTVGAAVEELAGWVFEALGEAAVARDALEHGHDTDTALRRLAACHERVNRICGCAVAGVVTHETHAQLGRLARELGGEWPGWLATLRVGLDSYGPPLGAVQAALLESWQEAAPPSRSAGDRALHLVPADINSPWRCSS